MTGIRANGTNQTDWPTGIYISAGELAARGRSLASGDSERMRGGRVAGRCNRANPRRCISSAMRRCDDATTAWSTNARPRERERERESHSTWRPRRIAKERRFQRAKIPTRLTITDNGWEIRWEIQSIRARIISAKKRSRSEQSQTRRYP